MSPVRSRLPLAALLFFVSGALGLGYELIWIKKAALVVGSSQIALATVLTSFFLGLGLGSLFVGRYLRSRTRSPLFVYGLFEAAIGLFALAFPFLFRGMEAVYGALWPIVGESTTGLFVVRFGLLFLLFLVPTFFMGGTLPLLLDGLVGEDRKVGSRTGLLYGLNVLGAVAGVLLTGYLGIPGLGMNGTSLLCGAGNLAIAAVALAVFRKARPLHAPEPESSNADRVAPFYSGLALISGFAAIGYQIAWSRYFGLFNVASVYRTALLLAVFLFGLAAGSLLLAPLLKRRVHPLRVIAVAQALVPLVVFLALDAWRLADYRFTPSSMPGTGEVAPSWYLFGENIDAFFLAPLFQIALVVLLPAMLLGTGLPSLIAAATRHSARLRSHAGSLVFWNTIGSAGGGFFAGYLLIPTVGLSGTLLFLGGLSLLLAGGAEWKLGREGKRGLLKPGYLLGAVALLWVLFSSDGDITRRTVERHWQEAKNSKAVLGEVHEGPLTTAYIMESDTHLYVAAGDVILAVINHNEVTTQAVQGHIPALFYPRPGAPQRCLGIALGSGQSFGALLMHPIEQLDVVDISTEMVDLSLRYFEPFNHGLASDERVTIHIDDGRHFVDRVPDAYYDVVSMEPPPPTAEGIFSLYSFEFYEAVNRILRDGGVLMQWLPLYMVTPEDLRGIIKTQSEIFPHTFVIRAGSSDFMVVSFKGESPPSWRPEWIAERALIFEQERLMAGTPWGPGSAYQAASPIGVVSMLLTGPGEIAGMKSNYIYHDDDQRLSYGSGDRRILERYHRSPRTISRLSFAALPITPYTELQRYFSDPIPTSELEEERAAALGRFGVEPPSRFAEPVLAYRNAAGAAEKARAAVAIAAIFDSRLAKQEALGWMARAIEANPAEQNPQLLDAARKITRNQIDSFSVVVETWLDSLPDAARQSALASAIAEELETHRSREIARRSAYLFE